MQYDLVIPQDPSQILDAKCLVVAAYYDKDERISFGIQKDIIDAFPEENELNIFFRLLRSPKMISDFYDENRELLQKEYWSNVTEQEFLNNTLESPNTQIELKKLDYTLNQLMALGIDTREKFENHLNEPE